MPKIRDDPRKAADDHRDITSPARVTIRGREITSHNTAGARQDRNLRACPQAAPQGEAEQRQIAPRRLLPQAEREQQHRETQYETRAVEPMRASRFPDEVGRPDPEQQRGEASRRLSDETQSNSPDQDRRDAPERDWNDPDRERRCSEQPYERNAEEYLLRSPVSLAPHEDAEVTVQRAASHRPPNTLVAVQRAERRGQHPDAEKQTDRDPSHHDRNRHVSPSHSHTLRRARVCPESHVGSASTTCRVPAGVPTPPAHAPSAA